MSIVVFICLLRHRVFLEINVLRCVFIFVNALFLSFILLPWLLVYSNVENKMLNGEVQNTELQQWQEGGQIQS